MSEVFVPPGQLQTAVLFLVFNRPDTTERVFEAIREAKPPRLYVAADGPRPSREGEAARVAQVRQIATAVDWSCEVKTLFREKNLGCKLAVSGGIDWFFENEEQGIILEDDCLPHPDFFTFCETLLNRYAQEERVWVVTGDNFQNGQHRGDASYYFSRYNHVWGWASWRRAWSKRDMEIKFWPEWKKSLEWKAWLPDKVERKYWSKIFDQMYRNEIDTWDYPWTASLWLHGGLTATPNVNLVSNIGFGSDATHTGSANSPFSMMTTVKLGELRYPEVIKWNVEADSYAFDKIFGGGDMCFPKIIAVKIIHKTKKTILKLKNICMCDKKSFFDRSRHLINRVAKKGWRILSSGVVKRKSVVENKRRLAVDAERFCDYKKAVFVFQTFNKGWNIRRVLRAFIDINPANVILFADGCIDNTVKEAAKLLRGNNHLIINANDLHEISNYKIATIIGKSWGCQYVVLLQDDDIYQEPVRAWLDLALRRFDEDENLSIIGLNSGFHLTKTPPMAGDEKMASAIFEISERDGKIYHRLGRYEEVVSSSVMPTPDGTNFEYVAIVNRAPQIIRIDDAVEMGFFPEEMRPYQYDDYYNCFQCWINNKKVMLMPISGKIGDVGMGGMRLYNGVRINSRPAHFSNNFNYVLKYFGKHWESGVIQNAVAEANLRESA